MDLFVPLWSERIQEEVVASLVRTGRVSINRAETRFAVMNEAFPDALVENWSDLEAGIFGLPDENDRHVVAAAIEGNASAIVTDNIKDFPTGVLGLHGLHAKHSDEFLLDVLDMARDEVQAALVRMVDSRTRPPVTMEELLWPLRVSCPNFCGELEDLGFLHRETGGI